MILEPHGRPKRFYVSKQDFMTASELVIEGKEAWLYFFKDADKSVEAAIKSPATREMCAKIELGQPTELPEGALLKGEDFEIKLGRR